MAGRGRGRGRGSFTFDTGALGFGKGETLPAALLQPPPLYPQREFQPSPLSNTEVDEYILALKQEFRAGMEVSQYFIKSNVKSNDIKRYSDKYKTNHSTRSEFMIDNRLLPKELQVKVNRKKAKVQTPPNITKRKRRRIESDSSEGTTVEVLEKVIEEKVIEDDEEVKEGDEVEEEEEYYEEDEEEENDYLVNHYDEGEDDFGMGDDDDADEGPVY